MKMIGFAAATILAASAGPVFAEKDTQAAAVSEPAATSDALDPNKKICKTEGYTGSLTRKNRVCMTRAQWDKLSEQTRVRVNNYIYESQRPDRQRRDAQSGLPQ